MAEKQKKAESVTEPVQEVDRIREIIFGNQMRDYQQQFQAMQRDLERLRGDIDRLGEQLSEQDSGQGKKIETLRKETRQANDELRDELRQTAQQLGADKVDRLALGELFIEIGSQLKTGGSLASLLQELEEHEGE